VLVRLGKQEAMVEDNLGFLIFMYLIQAFPLYNVVIHGARLKVERAPENN